MIRVAFVCWGNICRSTLSESVFTYKVKELGLEDQDVYKRQAYTIKMSKMGKHKIQGYFDYVVPPLEGFWWQEGSPVSYTHLDVYKRQEKG